MVGKTVRSALQLRGGGSALPGLVVEKIDPDFVGRTLASLPSGVVLVSGTNGKTTTTKMVVELLESQGLRVFTNRTGSNFVRGVAAALLGAVDASGELHADIAVLELDEAHAVHFVRAIPPRYSLFLNVMRDQLDRFGEIDTTARLLQTVAEATTEHVVLNREDPRICALAEHTDAKVDYFGLNPQLQGEFPSDDDMRSQLAAKQHVATPALVTLESTKNATASFSFGGALHDTTLQLRGVYNIFNAAAALALVLAVLGDEANVDQLMSALAKVQPAFGRGERLVVGGQPIDIVLVKNPSGFRLSLKSFEPSDSAIMVAINDNYADGRDMSWLWDVDFEALHGNTIVLSGVRAYDMAVRLQYDEVDFRAVEPNIGTALKVLLDAAPDQPKRLYCSYTAMLAVRRELAKLTDVEKIS